MSRLPWFTLAASVSLSLSACGGKDADTSAPINTGGDDTAEATCQDDDSDCDGVPDDQDCAPDDPNTYPGADEIPYDGIDNDCAGDGDITDWDGDGYDSDYVGGDDCNDGNPDIHPGAAEICYNDRDENCDGEPADGEQETWDCDGDGFEGKGEDATDCDDEDPTIFPGAVEVWYDGVDGDCAGPNVSDYDADGDGDDAEGYDGGGDCDDSDPLTASINNEIWDGVDRDCDGDIDTLTIYDAAHALNANSSSGDIYFGWSLFVGDDYDGDGNIDFGACGWASSDEDKGANGWCEIFSADGSTDGVPSTVAYARIEGDNGEYLGFDSDNMGDLDGDGWSEIAIGSALYDGNGGVLIFDGATLSAGGNFSPSAALAVVTGDTYLGVGLANIGDVDGDGVDDLAASAGEPYVTGANLAGGVWSGDDLADGGELGDSDALALFSSSSTAGEIVGGGDLDGDGLMDLVVAKNTQSWGAAYVMPATDLVDNAVLDSADYDTITGQTTADGLGVEIAIFDDLDGDGLADVALSAAGVTTSLAEEGVVYIVSGADMWAAADAADAAIATIEGVTPYGRIATTGEHAVDYDMDGFDDLIVAEVAAQGKAVIRGVVYAIPGSDIASGGTILTSDSFAQFPSRTDGDWLGFSGIAWDREGDGDHELAIGAPFNIDYGAAEVFFSGFAD